MKIYHCNNYKNSLSLFSFFTFQILVTFLNCQKSETKEKESQKRFWFLWQKNGVRLGYYGYFSQQKRRKMCYLGNEWDIWQNDEEKRVIFVLKISRYFRYILCNNYYFTFLIMSFNWFLKKVFEEKNELLFLLGKIMENKVKLP